MQRVILDEGVGRRTRLWETFARWLGDRPAEIVEVAQRHSGIPDTAILGRLLEPGDILVTSDRVLHNQALAAGFRSFTLAPTGDLTWKPLAGIRVTAPKLPPSKGDLKESYHREPSPLARLLRATMSERELKPYRTRRRRISSQFGSRDQLSQIAVTIGERQTHRGTLSGFFLRVAGQSRKAIDATEGYCIPADGSRCATYCVIQALVDVYLLDLEDLTVELFVSPPESLALCRTLMAAPASATARPDEQALRRLLLGLPKATIQPCVKRPFFTAMERKLDQLGTGSSNEVRVVNFGRWVEAVPPCVRVVVASAGDIRRQQKPRGRAPSRTWSTAGSSSRGW